MHRVCFTLQVRPDRLDEYRRRHAAVWPDMLVALHRAGWRDYSLFLRDDGLLVGYFLTEDLAAARAAMEATEVNRRWQEEMAPFFTASTGSDSVASHSVGSDTAGSDTAGSDTAGSDTAGSDTAGWRPDRGMHVLDEVFNLEDQLGAVR